MSSTSTLEIRINNLVKESIVDGFGLRFVVFTQGCKLRCPFCHNPQTHDLTAGHFIAVDEIRKMWKKNPLLTGITISGGEPFLQPDACLKLVEMAHEDGLDVIVYSGYTYEALSAKDCEATHQLLNTADYLVDGPFIYQLKNLNLLFRGSSNQRFIDLHASHTKGEVVTYFENM